MKNLLGIAPVGALILTLAFVPADKKPSTTTSVQKFTLQNCALTPSSRIHAGVHGAPRIRDRNGTASNWGGYVVETSLASPQKGSVNAVNGSWRIPTVTRSASPETYSAIWVGIDGDSDNTVEQLGTEQDWTPAGQTNYVWFEMYPHRSYTITGFPIEPGDTFSASVNYAGGNLFILSITNLTKGVAYTVPPKYTKMNASRESAEWIVEPPFAGGVLPLADFGTVSFSSCSATVNGVTGAIDNPAWQYDPITMASGGTVKAQPSALKDSNVHGTIVSAFSVKWYHE
jgi:hypothetical protein